MTRRYSDREVALILRRALEPQADGAGPEASEEGLSLDQLKEVAAEVGIDPARIESAAASLLEPEPAPKNPYAGIPTTVQFQTTLEERELDATQLPDVLTAIRTVQGRQGVTGSEFGSLEWRAKDALGARYVSLIPTQEGIRVRVMGNFRDGLIVIGGVAGTMALALGAVLAESAGLGGWSFPVAAALAAAPPRFIYRWLRGREDAKLRETFDRVVGVLRARASPPGAVEDGEEHGAALPPAQAEGRRAAEQQ